MPDVIIKKLKHKHSMLNEALALPVFSNFNQQHNKRDRHDGIK